MVKLDLSKAITALKSGNIVVYPTDTLYGLGADIYNVKAVRKIFQIKKRSFDNPLSVAISDISELEKIAFLNETSRRLARAFLPGRLTLILKKRSIIPDIVTAGLENVAVRIPDNKVALELLSEFGPLTATSANIHGKKTPDIIKKISMQFKKEDISVYLDIGKLDGKPSTIVDATGKSIKLLRLGAISEKEILDAI
ncbi:MAG: threonylcarbamoyl-AMP synthase [Thermoplasmatales archaeon]|nr:MAG: threonylcarbamoyl-AMP synthase [Thermoplasmatales archaeon]